MYYKKYYFIGLIYILLVILITFKLFINRKEFFILETKSDMEIIDLYNTKYIWEIDFNNLIQQLQSQKTIKSPEIRYIIPNKLFIKSKQRSPVAVWWNYEKFFLVDEEGIVISDSVTDKDKKQYIFLVGIGALTDLKRINKIITHSQYNGKIASMRYIGQRRWDIVLRNSTMIKLPEKNEKQAFRLLNRLLYSNNSLIAESNVFDLRLAPEKVFLNRSSYVEK